MKKAALTVMASLVAMIANAQERVPTKEQLEAKSVDTFNYFESDVNLEHRMNLPPMTQTVLTFLDLPGGDWSVNGEVNLFVYGNNNTQVHYGGFLGFVAFVDQSDARVTVGSATTSYNRIDKPVPLVGRRIHVDAAPGMTRRVYLTVYIWTDSGLGITSAAIYGFAYAVRVAP